MADAPNTFSFEDAQQPASDDNDQTGSVSNTFSFEDAQQPATPNQSATPTPPSQANTFSFEDASSPAADANAPQPSVSLPGAAAVGAVKGAAPTVGAIAGGMYGAGIGEAAFPAGGGLVGGVAGAVIGSGLVSQAQQWFIDKLGLDQGSGFLSNAYEQAAEQQHPVAHMAGELAPMAAGFGPAGAGAASRALSAAIMGGGQAAQEYVENGSVNPWDVGTAAVAGAVLPTPREWAARAQSAGQTVGEALMARMSATKSPATETPIEQAATADTTSTRPDLNNPTPDRTDAKIAATDDATVPPTVTGEVAEEKPQPQGANEPAPPPGQADTTQAATISVVRGARDEGKGSTVASREGVVNAESAPGLQQDPIDKTVKAALDGISGNNEQAPAPGAQTVPPAPQPQPAPTPGPPAPVQTGLQEAARGQPQPKAPVVESENPAPPLDEKAVLDRVRSHGYGDVADMIAAMPPQTREVAIRHADEMYPEGYTPPAPAETPAPAVTPSVETPTSSEKPLVGKFWNMLKDTTGGGNFPPFEWMRRRPNDPLSIDRDASATAYGDSLGPKFQERRSMQDNVDSFIRKQMEPLAKYSAEDRQKIYQAQQDNELDKLPQNLQDAYTKYVKPLEDSYYEAYKGIQAQGGDLPDPFKGVTKRFVPRMEKGNTVWESPNETNDAMVRLRGLTDWAGPLQERKYFALDDGQGTRLTFQPNDDGSITLWRDGKPTQTQTPVGFSGKPGDTLNMFGKTFTVDHAATDELTKDVRVPGPDGKPVPLEFHEDPIAWANAYRGAQGVYDNMKLVNDIKSDPRFLAHTTVDKTEAINRGYNLNPTTLQQVATRGGKQLYMPNSIKWPLDDFAHAGFNSDSLEKANRAASSLVKTLYTFGSPVHALNVLDTAIVGRGLDWINPKAYKTMATTMLTAQKAVTDPNSALYSVLANHGAGLMSQNVLNSELMPKLAKQAGIEMKQNPSLWDPISKQLGVSIPEMGKAMYDASRLHMWQFSDMLVIQRVLENMELHGMNLDQAVQATHQTIPNYQIGSKLLGSRLAAQTVRTPALSLFGLYHGGLWRAYGNIIHDAVAGASPAKRNAAIGQMLMMGVMGFAVYPMLDKFAQTVTGNSNAKFGRRGLSTIPSNMYDFLHSDKTGRDYSTTAANIFTPSLLVQAAGHVLGNKDWTGKEILPPRDYTKPGNAVRGALRIGDEAAQTLIPPYGTISQAAQMAHRTHGSALQQAGAIGKKFIERNVGIQEPSPAEMNYIHRLPLTGAADEIKRRNNAGIPERIYNSLTNGQ